jgi:hypothetical protein
MFVYVQGLAGGELLVAQKAAGEMNRGSAGIGKAASAVPEEYHTLPPTLAVHDRNRQTRS